MYKDTVASCNIPKNVLIFSNHHEVVNTGDSISKIVNPSNKNSVDSMRERMYVYKEDPFLKRNVYLEAEEVILDNSGFNIIINPNIQPYDSNKSIFLIRCTLIKDGLEFNIDFEAKSILELVGLSTIENGRIKDTFKVGFISSIPYLISESYYKEDEIKQVANSKKVSTTTKYELGRVYQTKMKSASEIYLGEFYTHWVEYMDDAIGYPKLTGLKWSNEPIPVWGFVDLYNLPSRFSIYGNELVDLNFDDMVDALKSDYNIYSRNKLTIPRIVRVLDVGMKTNKVPRVATDICLSGYDKSKVNELLELARNTIDIILNGNVNEWDIFSKVKILGYNTEKDPIILSDKTISKICKNLFNDEFIMVGEDKYFGSKVRK